MSLSAFNLSATARQALDQQALGQQALDQQAVSTLSEVATQPSTQQQRERYLTELLAQALASAQKSPLADTSIVSSAFRQAAAALVKEQSFPAPKDEAWRFTNLAPMLALPFVVPHSEPLSPEQCAQLKVQGLQLALPEQESYRLVFVNGTYCNDLSSLDDLPEGITVSALSQLEIASPTAAAVTTKLAQVPGGNEVFTALNSAGFADAVVVRLAPNRVLDKPVEVFYLNLAQAEPVMVQPRCLVMAEKGSAVTLVETFWGDPNHCPYFTNGVTELWLEDNAEVKHIRVQQEAATAFHVGKTGVSQAKDSRYHSVSLSLGGQLSRHHLEVYQTGANTDTQLLGLSANQAQQLSDTHSLVVLNHPGGTMRQLQKNIADDQAHIVFNGKVLVGHGAQLTNASQLNRNLLLSTKARIDAKPELDIVADNVKCAHGATVSQLEADEIFYLQSRGISAEAGQRLLLKAFALEIVEQISLDALKPLLTDLLIGWNA
jgi:Fe-S cluster assembly protein SufD